MAAITLSHDWINYTHGFPALAGAAINEPYAAVILGSNPGEVIQSSAANQAGVGYIKSDSISRTFNLLGAAAVAAADTVTVFYTGIVWAVASAALATPGTLLSTAAAGQVGASAGANKFIGISLAAAAAQHELLPVLVTLGSAA